jgi:Cas7 group CRISPR-associated protein Csh2
MTTPNDSNGFLSVMTGLLILEVCKSNPNGDPDNDGAPRIRADGKGEISPVSVKRKARDLIGDKEGIIWTTIAAKEELDLDPAQYQIIEERGRDKVAIIKQLESGQAIYWDGRVFGNTLLEEGKKNGHERTGAIQLGVGFSIAPIEIEYSTWSNKAGVEADKDRGMAPNAHKVVRHGLYAVPFFIDPTAGRKSGCKWIDIQVFLTVLKYVYARTRSVCRTEVELIHAHVLTHANPCGSCRELSLIEALTPKKLSDPNDPSTSLSDYVIPQWSDIQDKPADGTLNKTYAQCGTYQDWALFD